MNDGSDGPRWNADVGEVETVRESVELHTVNFAPDAFYGSDRIADYGVADVEIVEDEYGDETLKVTFEGEVTKRLPRNWDSCLEPRTAAEEKKARRSKWLETASQIAPLFIGLGVAFLVASQIFEQLAGMTVVPASPEPPGLVFLFSYTLAVAFVLWAILYLPGRVSRGRVA